MDKLTKAKKIQVLLEKKYPYVKCMLDYQEPHELLIATRLSAQCTDKRVNMVTPGLFARFKSVDDFAKADVDEVAGYIKSCGLYKSKAKDIVMMCCLLKDAYNCQIPDSIEELLKLPGVGRKTANLIVGDLYGKPAIVTDTHVIRLSNRLGLADSTVPYKVETQLAELIDPSSSMQFCHRMVTHGREICDARKPKCDICILNGVCDGFPLAAESGRVKTRPYISKHTP